MRLSIQASCGCHIGKIRKNNEDNFFFDGKYLETKNTGLKDYLFLEKRLKRRQSFAVFDGIGGEYFGELASYAAAQQMRQTKRDLTSAFVPMEKYIRKLLEQLNDAVFKAKSDMLTERMGTTVAALCFDNRHVYSCNIGDSRVYRLRGDELLQLSKDHVEKIQKIEKGKAPLTQYLGIDPDDMQIEPSIIKKELKSGDQYILCSDGLSDILTNFEIAKIMLNNEETITCVKKLIDTALAHGGRDNITVIVCRLI